jgi:hypothetical protein
LSELQIGVKAVNRGEVVRVTFERIGANKIKRIGNAALRRITISYEFE